MQAWSPFYWADYVADTAHLSLAEHGAYLMLMAHYYNTGKPLVANATILQRICHAHTDAEQEAIAVVLTAYFRRDGDVYRHNRIDRELAKGQYISQLRRENGRRGGLAKAKNLPEQTPKQNPSILQPQLHKESITHAEPKHDDFHAIQYAARICDELVIPKKGNMETVGGAIEALAKSRKTTPFEAYEYLLAKALSAKETGETVNLFWFRDGKYNISKAVTRDNYKTAAQLRNERSAAAIDRAFSEGQGT